MSKEIHDERGKADSIMDFLTGYPADGAGPDRPRHSGGKPTGKTVFYNRLRPEDNKLTGTLRRY